MQETAVVEGGEAEVLFRTIRLGPRVVKGSCTYRWWRILKHYFTLMFLKPVTQLPCAGAFVF